MPGVTGMIADISPARIKPRTLVTCQLLSIQALFLGPGIGGFLAEFHIEPILLCGNFRCFSIYHVFIINS